MTKKKAFLTGITGQDGSYLAEFLIDKESGTVSFDDENDVLDTELVAYSQFRH